MCCQVPLQSMLPAGASEMQKDSSAVTIHDTAAVADAIARETKQAHKLVRLAVLLCIVYCVLCIVYCVLCIVYCCIMVKWSQL